MIGRTPLTLLLCLATACASVPTGSTKADPERDPDSDGAVIGAAIGAAAVGFGLAARTTPRYRGLAILFGGTIGALGGMLIGAAVDASDAFEGDPAPPDSTSAPDSLRT